MVKLQCPESLDIRPNGLESNISLGLLSLSLRMGRENWRSGEMDTAGERPGMGEERETRLKRAAAQGAQKNVGVSRAATRGCPDLPRSHT